MAVTEQSAVSASLGRAGTSILALFTATMFCGAILVFSVQPMVAKMVLPSFGGSPAVWNTALVFFQAALLAGYGYAHLLARVRKLRHQIEIHVAMLALAALALPIAVASGWVDPAGAAPALRLLGLLAASVGLPFLVISATAPLIQHWFTRSGHPHAADPYFLYAASNVGSILALLGYPLMVDPWLAVSAQSHAWTAAYVVTGVLIVACGLLAVHGGGKIAPAAEAGEIPADAMPCVSSWRKRGRWIACSAVPSALLIGVTNHITTDLASAPMLWVVPLALYLLTFVIVFARKPLIAPTLVAKVFPCAVACLAATFTAIGPAFVLLPLHLAVFFIAALLCHGELAQDRPAAKRLTEFYFSLSLGGVLGGMAAALIAPAVFDALYEYPLALVAACLLMRRDNNGGLRRADLARAATILIVIFGGWQVAGALDIAHGGAVGGGLAAFGAISALGCKQRSTAFAMCIAAVFVGTAFGAIQSETVVRARSFFGAYRVANSADGAFRVLMHGTTLHGAQHLDPDRRNEPASYYAVDGPVGEIIGRVQAGASSPAIGVVGLGAGSLACYRRPEDKWRFFEIDPLVVRLATDPRYFSFIADCAGPTSIVVGDARLTLANEPEGALSLLIIDAFSSDAIPIHLITREALALYVDKLATNGIIVIHISNRHLDLEPVLARAASALGLAGRSGRKIDGSADGISSAGSHWIALARTQAALERLDLGKRWTVLPAGDGKRVWTDAYSDIVGALRW